MRLLSPFVAFLLLVSSALPAAAELVPHRAVYSIDTGTVRPGSDYTGVKGSMVMVMEKTCEAWLTAQDITLFLSPTEGDVIQQGLRFASRESLDGLRYRFSALSRFGDTVEESRGRARLTEQGGAGEAVFERPEEMVVPLPEGTYFPVSHTRWIIERGREGGGQFTHRMFDGADGTGPNEAVVFVGSRVEAQSDQPLRQGPGWPLRLSYYASDSRAPEPEYELDALQLANGVVPELTLDYQTFTARMTLESLERLPEPDCGAD